MVNLAFPKTSRDSRIIGTTIPKAIKWISLSVDNKYLYIADEKGFKKINLSDKNKLWA